MRKTRWSVVDETQGWLNLMGRHRRVASEIPHREVSRSDGLKTGLRSVSRALDILEALGASEKELSLTEISISTGLHASTASRFLGALVERGYVRRNATSGHFSLGLATLQLGAKAQSQLSWLRDAARPLLQRLARDTQETAILALLDRDAAVTVDLVESPWTVRVISYVGERIPLYCTGAGKALLAYLPPAHAQKLINCIDFRAYTHTTLIDARRLEEELEGVRRRGYAVNDEEYEAGGRSAAAPVFAPGEIVVAALAISGPTIRVSRETLDEFGLIVKHAASELSRELKKV